METQKPLAVPQKKNLFTPGSPLVLDAGGVLPHVDCAYEAYGTLNSAGDNAILICHALSSSAHAALYHRETDKDTGWWDGLIGDGKAFDTSRYYVVCSAILGSCFGTTGPTSINPDTGKPYLMTFPQITVRDMVRVQERLVQSLGINRLVTVAGASVGAFQVMEWAVMFPGLVESAIPIASALRQPAWVLAYNHIKKQAIKTDASWHHGNYKEVAGQQPKSLDLIRQIGMVTYRSPDAFEERFGRNRQDESGDYFDIEQNRFAVQSYLDYHGAKFLARFDANSYLKLSDAFDLFDISAGRGTLKEVCRTVIPKVFSIGTSSDMLYPPAEQRRIADLIPNARYYEMISDYGHDAFLIEIEVLTRVIKNFLADL